MKSIIRIALGAFLLSSIPARGLANPVDDSPRVPNDRIQTERPMLAGLYPSGMGTQTQKTDSPWDGAAGGALIGGIAGGLL